jgi:dolichol-phosphate mannosyltransferase
MTIQTKPWISVVVPIKDERDNLHPLTNQLTKVLGALEQSQAAPFEIVYVDDGSTDGSSALLDEIRQHTPEVQVVHFDKNHGQTAAFDAGFRHAQGELIATLDGDLQYDPADLTKLLPLTKTFDLVCGRRQKRLDNIIRQLSSRTAYLIRNAVIHDGIHDTGCSLKIFRRSVIERMALFHNMHRFFPALAKMHGFSVTEVPVQHFPRAHGHSKYGIGNRLFAGLYDLIAVRWMQKRCFHYEIVNTPGDSSNSPPKGHS